MATIKERPGKNGKTTYQVRIRLKGHPLQCGTFSNITKAKLFIQQTEAVIRDGRYFKCIEAKKHTLGDLIDRYIRDVLPKKPKSLSKQTAQLLWWKKRIGHLILTAVTAPVLVEQRDKFSSEKMANGKNRSPSTVCRYLAALSHAFSIAVREWGWLDDNPMRKVSKSKEPRGRVRFLDAQERVRLLEACKNSKHPTFYLIVVLALSTGMRRGEIMNLNWKEVELENARIVLQHTKNGERRVVPLVGYALELFTAYSKQPRTDAYCVFPGIRDPKKPFNFRTVWENAVKESNLEDFRFHDLRHSFASALAMNKATQTELRILLGHKSHSMTARYSHLTEAHGASLVSDVMEKIFPNQKGGNE